MWCGLAACSAIIWSSVTAAKPVDQAPVKGSKFPQGKITQYLLAQKNGTANNLAQAEDLCSFSELKPDYDPEPLFGGE